MKKLWQSFSRSKNFQLILPMIIGSLSTVLIYLLIKTQFLKPIEILGLGVFAVLYYIGLGFFKKKESPKAPVVPVKSPAEKLKFTPESTLELMSELRTLKKMIETQNAQVITIHNTDSKYPAYLIPSFGARPNEAFFNSIAQAETIKRNLVEKFDMEKEIKIILPLSVSKLNKIRPYSNGNKAILPKNLQFPMHLINFN